MKRVYRSMEESIREENSILLYWIKCLINGVNFLYQLYLDKGFERDERRRELRRKNCQVRMEMKDYANSRKKGPRFVFDEEHKHTRGLIEKVVAWLKAFAILRLNRLRKKSLIRSMFFF